jgi:O-antigen ligase
MVLGSTFALILLLFPLLILTGSRAGLALSAPTLAVCCWMLLQAPATKALLRRAGERKSMFVGGAAAVLAAPLIFVAATLLLSSRETALSRLFAVDAADDLRWSFLPISMSMARDFFPLGSGFGSFERVFMMYETADILSLRYANQAHNDVVQVVLEGGLPAIAIVLAALAWGVRSLWRMWRDGDAERRLAALFLGSSIALWLAASVVDYPLRTPLAAMVFATLTAHLSFLSTEHRSARAMPGEHDAQDQAS